MFWIPQDIGSERSTAAQVTTTSSSARRQDAVRSRRLARNRSAIRQFVFGAGFDEIRAFAVGCALHRLRPDAKKCKRGALAHAPRRSGPAGGCSRRRSGAFLCREAASAEEEEQAREKADSESHQVDKWSTRRLPAQSAYIRFKPHPEGAPSESELRAALAAMSRGAPDESPLRAVPDLDEEVDDDSAE